MIVRWDDVPVGQDIGWGAPPHLHSADEEVFVILEGGGTLELWPSPVRAEDTEREEHETRAGEVVWRPPSTGIAHFLRGGAEE